MKLRRLQSTHRKPESYREGKGIEGDGQGARRNRRPLHQNCGTIDRACFPGGKPVGQVRERVPHAH